MTPDLMMQQWAVAWEHLETILIVSSAAYFLLGLTIFGVVLYLTFGKVLIPLSRSLCNYLDAKAWHVDHQYRPRPGYEPVPQPDDPNLRYMPKV